MVGRLPRRFTKQEQPHNGILMADNYATRQSDAPVKSPRSVEMLADRAAERTDGVLCQIREISARDREDLAKVAKLHMEFLSFGPLAGLGETFVRQIGYAAPIRDGRLRVALYVVDGVTAGYIAFTDKALEFQTRTIREHWASVAWILAGYLLRHPHRVGGLFKAARASAAHREESGVADGLCGEVAALVVRPDYCTADFYRRARVRISEELIRYAAACLKQTGMRALRTFVDAGNRPVLMVYNRFGARFENLEYGGVPTIRVALNLENPLCEFPRTAMRRT